MRTDTLFYQLFQTFHTLLFELTEQPVAAAAGYEFVSVEVKEKAFRFDGVFLPDTIDKFPKLSREEIQAMFTLNDLKQTRYYQETKQEGVLEGMQRGVQQGQSNLILRLLVRKFGVLSEESRSNITQLSPTQIEGLAEAILDFTNVAELDRWLQENK